MTVAPEGRRMLRVEARNAQTPIERKPEWIRTTAKMGPEYTAIHSLVKGEGLHTVCQEAGCPNIFECWEDREATFLIGGDTCTRRCDFCDIATGRPQALDLDEPRRVAESVRTMGLRYSTVTGVARDDLPDGAAGLYAETIRSIRELNPGAGIEVLADDLGGRPEHLALVFDAAPEVFAHNVETVPRIFKRIRPAFRYDRSLDVITQARDYGLVTKSNLILGMGETREEVSQALVDLIENADEVVVSTISCFEMAWLVRHGRIELDVGLDEWFAEVEASQAVRYLPVTAEIARRAVDLPEHHRDPQDRIIIATALQENAQLISFDTAFPIYAVLNGRLIGR